MADRVNLDDSVSSGASARHRVKVVSGLVLLPLAVGAAWAQPASISATEKARALQLLHSVPCLDKAWGAYFAGRLHAEQLREPLMLPPFTIREIVHSVTSCPKLLCA